MGPTLFNVFLADLSFIVGDIDILSYVDDITRYVIESTTNDLIESKEQATNAQFDI